MPPRTSLNRLPKATPCQCFSTRPVPSQTNHQPHPERLFHVSTRSNTRLRREMFDWLGSQGKVFRQPLQGSTNYLGAYDKKGNLLRVQQRLRDGRRRTETEEEDEEDENEDRLTDEDQVARAAAEAAEAEERGGIPKERQIDLRPYPLNRQFKSEPVLSEELREELYRQVVVRKMDISAVSAAFGVDMRRVAAVVRLKTVEKQWQEKGKPLAKPYAEAVLAMLPKTKYSPEQRIVPHESINDLPVHPATRKQLFYPTSESRRFTREDAAKAFSPTLLSADKRIPHPELVQIEKWNIAEVPREKRLELMRAKDEEARVAKDERERKERAWRERTQRVVAGRRWDFKFQDISAESARRDGRGRQGVGIRYGMPHEDRKRGQIKIPTSVE